MICREEHSFGPYAAYCQNVKQIREFEQLTTLSYGLALQLLFDRPREKLSTLLPKGSEDKRGVSFAMGSQTASVSAAWLTFREYAEKESLKVHEVEGLASEGKLGTVQTHPNSGEQVVIWPAELQAKPLRELPKPGTYVVVESAEGTSEVEVDLEDVETFEETQRMFLAMAHALGEPNSVADRAAETLRRSCFLLHWGAFEVFLRSTILDLIRRHPSKIASTKKSGERSLTYEDILKLSEQLTSVEGLRDGIINREIERQQAGGESVDGLIKFLKREFRFDRDPYEAWYVLGGKRAKAHYGDLTEIREVRNALLHDAGKPGQSFFDQHPSVTQREKSIVIDSVFYLKARLILDSIAFSIADSIDSGAYKSD